MVFLIIIGGIAHSNLNPTLLLFIIIIAFQIIYIIYIKCAIQNKLAYMYDFREIFNRTFAHQLFEI